MHSGDQYYERREAEERLAAEQATDPRARQSHLDMAEEYARGRERRAEQAELARRIASVTTPNLKLVQ